jgi:hypothetical protein
MRTLYAPIIAPLRASDRNDEKDFSRHFDRSPEGTKWRNPFKTDSSIPAGMMERAN